MAKFSYYGAHKWRNIGDIAVYLAVRKLLDGHTLFENQLGRVAIGSVIGGGTLFPRVIYPGAGFRKRKINITIGTGIRHPDFWNAKHTRFDVRYYAGTLGFNSGKFIKSLPFPFEGAIQAIDSRLQSIDVTGEVVRERDLRDIGDIGFDILTVRGPRSKQLLTEVGIESTIVGDPALYLDPPDVDAREGQVAVSLREPYGYYWGSESQCLDAISEFCKRHDQINFVFVPLNPKDYDINSRTSSKYPNANLIDYSSITDLDGLLEEYARSEFVIGERLHAAVLSAAANTPFVSIAYRPKHIDFLQSINAMDWNIRRDKISYDSLISIAENVIGIDCIPQPIQKEIDHKRKSLESVADEIDRISEEE